MDKVDIILDKLNKLEEGQMKLEKGYQKLETGQKKIQKDITDIHGYLKIGLDEHINRLKNRITELEKKVM